MVMNVEKQWQGTAKEIISPRVDTETSCQKKFLYIVAIIECIRVAIYINRT